MNAASARGPVGDGTTAELAAVAAELYALAPDEFTAARNDRAKAARSGGGAELAAGIRRLPKPSAAAWMINMMVNQRREEIEQFLKLGASLRAAQEELDPGGLRGLNRQRHQLLQALVRESRAAAGRSGHKVSDAVAAEVEQTLRTAMARPEAAAAVRTGQLIRALASDVLETGDPTGFVAVPTAFENPVLEDAALEYAVREADGGADSEAGRASVRANRRRPEPERAEDERAKVLQEARRAAETAEGAAGKAQADLETANRLIRELATRRGRLEAGLKDLKDRLADAEREAAAATSEARGLERNKDKAARAAEESLRRAARARAHLDRLAGSARD
jgi:hypothetical protein